MNISAIINLNDYGIKEVDDKIVCNFQEVANNNTNRQIFIVFYRTLSRLQLLDRFSLPSGVQYVAKYLVYRRVDMRKYIPPRIIAIKYKSKSI